ncbi:MAG: glycosyltransferase [Bacteroidales bacterium]|nr:glycosyltransferase [Bacteroidales bacterium]
MDPDSIKSVKGSETQGHRFEGGLSTKGVTKKEIEEKPLVSIITVVLNGEDYILETINSVLNQTYDNIEFIIIDGGSTDGTLDIIRKFEERIDLWVSEPDRGIYDAMNKGIAFATGSYLNFLNSDDHYVDSRVLERIIGVFKKTGVALVYGDTIMLNKSKGFGWLRHSDVNPLYFLFKGIPQQVFFYDRLLFQKYGTFNSEFKIVADLEYFLKITRKHGEKTKYVRMPLVVFNAGATSSNMEKKDEERGPVINQYFSKKIRFLFKNRFFFNQLARNDLTYPKITIVDRLLRKLFKSL